MWLWRRWFTGGSRNKGEIISSAVQHVKRRKEKRANVTLGWKERDLEEEERKKEEDKELGWLRFKCVWGADLILMMGCCLFVYYRVSVKNQNHFNESTNLQYRCRPVGGHVSGFGFCAHVSIFIKYKFKICLFLWAGSLCTSSTLGKKQVVARCQNGWSWTPVFNACLTTSQVNLWP